ncbi:MAG TPA: hypothetical protein VEK11_03370 [Thermoanaerobaculia bacterium]|nr:hypothetical protein [Thermoanaerobaculia bacterium]
MIYRKQGRSVRWENGVVVHVSESGIAVEEGEWFRCEPAPHAASGQLLAAPRGEGLGVRGIAVERLILTEGEAHHQYGDRQWTEHTRRMHLAMTRGPLRVLVDRADFDFTQARAIAAVLAKAELTERAAPPRLRLAPNITAALLPHLAGLAPPNVRLVQTAGGVDGYGNDIVEAVNDWPNFYRPSYRTRPVRMPHNLRLECSVREIDRDRPIAVALLAPVDGLVLRVLVDDGTRAFPATVRVTRIDAVADEREWYPYAAGSFGAEMML